MMDISRIMDKCRMMDISRMMDKCRMMEYGNDVPVPRAMTINCLFCQSYGNILFPYQVGYLYKVKRVLLIPLYIINIVSGAL